MVEDMKTPTVIKSTITLGKGTKEATSGSIAAIVAIIFATKFADALGLSHDVAVVLFTGIAVGAFKIVRNLLSEVLRRYGVDPTVLS